MGIIIEIKWEYIALRLFRFHQEDPLGCVSVWHVLHHHKVVHETLRSSYSFIPSGYVALGMTLNLSDLLPSFAKVIQTVSASYYCVMLHNIKHIKCLTLYQAHSRVESMLLIPVNCHWLQSCLLAGRVSLE